jgi:transglutaminase-like putative cysteine protease
MKRFLILLLILPVVFAASTDWFSAGLVKTEIEVSSSLNLDGDVKNVVADVMFVPQNSEFSAVREIKTNPLAVVSSDRVRFAWPRPQESTLTYSYRAVVDVANDAPRVRAKIPFPVRIDAFKQFQQPSKNIDSNHPAIIAQAQEIAKGEDDLFVVVSKLAMWVKTNVDYNLSTLTADVSQPASWVLENRYGVCDEMTSLFVAMVRALGVPAKFVSGVAYTDNPSFPGSWGAHGWAEVYFPGVGWVPFDPTFGEFAWVDPGHVKLKESIDPSEPTTSVEWLGGRVKTNPLTIKAKKLSSEGSVPNDVSMALKVVRDRVSFGSYNGVVLELENFADYYVAKEFTLSPVQELEVSKGLARQVILPPKSRAAVGWKVKIKEDINKNLQYSVPIVVSSIRNDSVSTSFGVGQFESPLSESVVDAAIEQASVRLPRPIELACILKDDLISSDVGVVDCVLRSFGPEGVARVCSSRCVDVSLQSNGVSKVSFDIPAKSAGVHPVEVVASLGSNVAKAQLSLIRLDSPSVVISDVVLPKKVSSADVFEINFMVTRQSVAVPRNVRVRVSGAGAVSNLAMGDLLIDQDVTVVVEAAQLYSSTPVFDIVATFEDGEGATYESEVKASMEVEGVPWYKRVVGFILNLLP